MKAWIAAALLIAPTAAQAQGADSFCAELARIVAAARERDPFASVDAPSPNRLLAFATFCWKVRMGGIRFACISDRGPAELTGESLSADVQRCYPGVVPDSEPSDDDPNGKDSRFVVDGARILITQRDYAEGRGVSLIVYPPERR